MYNLMFGSAPKKSVTSELYEELTARTSYSITIKKEITTEEAKKKNAESYLLDLKNKTGNTRSAKKDTEKEIEDIEKKISDIKEGVRVIKNEREKDKKIKELLKEIAFLKEFHEGAKEEIRNKEKEMQDVEYYIKTLKEKIRTNRTIEEENRKETINIEKKLRASNEEDPKTSRECIAIGISPLRFGLKIEPSDLKDSTFGDLALILKKDQDLLNRSTSDDKLLVREIRILEEACKELLEKKSSTVESFRDKKDRASPSL